MAKKTGFKKRASKGQPANGDSIADAIIDSIEAGTAPWMSQWNEFPPTTPRNAITGQLFNGLKAVSIMATGLTDPRWCTYSQASNQGWQVQRNPISVKMMYFSVKPSGEIDPVTGEPAASGDKVFKAYYMFNASQIKGAPEFDYTAERQWGDTVAIDDIVSNAGVRIVHGADAARYNREDDCIEMPNMQAYDRDLDYYADLVHEIARWTGGQERLNRSTAESGVDVIEELRVSIASLMMCAEYGLPHKPGNISEHTEEIAAILNSDKREIARVSMAAKDVCDYISQFAPAPDFLVNDSLGDGLFDDEDFGGKSLAQDYELVPESTKKPGNSM